MKITETYLFRLQGKIFKLLPLRENKDNGEKNHLEEYLDHLCTNFDGAYACYPELSSIPEITEIQANLWALRTETDIEFTKWRSAVLRSARLVQDVLDRLQKGA